MLNSAPGHNRQLRSRPSTQAPTVCVVDPQAGDYQGWNSQALAGQVRLHFVASADEALRLARSAAIDLWVINTELPGLSGCELCGMLGGRNDRAVMYLVADRYSSATEQAAWAAGATLFGCKPAHCDWLDLWLAQRTARSAR